ncbi:hypothetical protein K435DRAFT_964931 [Dendrothele bispora CBS 962.96]|uniref:DUF6534 domain-containing protein n=1 Tax=Dendrothele bispora (strain CBS 962.96) TaxID=1314807 RepID=A0A4S8M9D6_DENBC|nr:hypothetical protein K435DRAFT_964931 [Dendrothele bispora CBS 962.96]
MSELPDRSTPLSQAAFEQSYGSGYICMVIGVFLYGISILQTSSIVGTIVCFLVQGFFVHMIHQLAKGTWRIILTGILIPLILLQLAFGLYSSARQFQLWFPMQMTTSFVNSTVIPTLVFRIVPDTIISVSLCLILLYSRNEAKKTAKLVNTLIVYAIHRYTLTTVVLFVQMVVMLAIPQNKGTMAMGFVAAHLKVNSLLATLNARNRLRRMIDPVTIDSGIIGNQFKTGSAVQFAVPSQSPLQTAESFSCGTQELRGDNVVKIEKEIFVDRGYSSSDDVRKTTGNLV